MGEIKIHLDVPRDLSVFEVLGTVTCDDFLAAIKNQYSKHPTANSLWEFINVDMSGISTKDFMKIADAAKAYSQKRGRAKTIIVADKAMEEIIMKLYSAIAEAIGSPITYKVVATKDEAYQWFDRD